MTELRDSTLQRINELAAVELMRRSSRSGRPGSWTVTREADVEIGLIYDWADPFTGKVGQCWKGLDGSWKQAPLGSFPVVLHWKAGASS